MAVHPNISEGGALRRVIEVNLKADADDEIAQLATLGLL
jgi:hypothetical protein